MKKYIFKYLLKFINKDITKKKVKNENIIINKTTGPGKRFSDANSKILHDWYSTHGDADVSDLKKQILAAQTNLSYNQISQWFYKQKAKKNIGSDSFKNISFSHRIILKQHFIYENQNPDSKELNYLVNKTGLTEKKIKSWFSDQRYKIKNNKFTAF